jgi:hypothetical protein
MPTLPVRGGQIFSSVMWRLPVLRSEGLRFRNQVGVAQAEDSGMINRCARAIQAAQLEARRWRCELSPRCSLRSWWQPSGHNQLQLFGGQMSTLRFEKNGNGGVRSSARPFMKWQ